MTELIALNTPTQTLVNLWSEAHGLPTRNRSLTMTDGNTKQNWTNQIRTARPSHACTIAFTIGLCPDFDLPIGLWIVWHCEGELDPLLVKTTPWLLAHPAPLGRPQSSPHIHTDKSRSWSGTDTRLRSSCLVRLDRLLGLLDPLFLPLGITFSQSHQHCN